MSIQSTSPTGAAGVPEGSPPPQVTGNFQYTGHDYSIDELIGYLNVMATSYNSGDMTAVNSAFDSLKFLMMGVKDTNAYKNMSALYQSVTEFTPAKASQSAFQTFLNDVNSGLNTASVSKYGARNKDAKTTFPLLTQTTAWPKGVPADINELVMMLNVYAEEMAVGNKAQAKGVIDDLHAQVTILSSMYAGPFQTLQQDIYLLDPTSPGFDKKQVHSLMNSIYKNYIPDITSFNPPNEV